MTMIDRHSPLHLFFYATLVKSNHYNCYHYIATYVGYH